KVYECFAFRFSGPSNILRRYIPAAPGANSGWVVTTSVVPTAQRATKVATTSMTGSFQGQCRDRGCEIGVRRSRLRRQRLESDAFQCTPDSVVAATQDVQDGIFTLGRSFRAVEVQVIYGVENLTHRNVFWQAPKDDPFGFHGAKEDPASDELVDQILQDRRGHVQRRRELRQPPRSRFRKVAAGEHSEGREGEPRTGQMAVAPPRRPGQVGGRV